jgi:hypothetical protein
MNISKKADHALFNILHHSVVNGVAGSCHQLQLTSKHSGSNSVLIVGCFKVMKRLAVIR